MIKMKLVLRATHRAFATIPFPNGKLYRRRDHPPTLNITLRPDGEVLVTFNRDESEFEHLSKFIFFTPGIDQVKYAIVRPYTGSNLFIHADPLGILREPDG